MELNKLLNRDIACSCGRVHRCDIDVVDIGRGAIDRLSASASKYENILLVADSNTYGVCGEAVCAILGAKINSVCIFETADILVPDEAAIAAVRAKMTPATDLILGIGSGVINDISKILAHRTNHPYIIVASAAYMDGYASGTSSMALGGVKVTVKAKAPEVIIGDLDILSGAPVHMAKAGLGDMLAKYIAICEWRISNLINGEYYCEQVAQLIRNALKKCVDNAAGLLQRDEKAIEAVFEGLVIGGIAMAYAGVSRPASGVEHYFSHIWDMRGLEFGSRVDLHGIQCAVATLQAVKLYESIKRLKPDAEKAKAFVDGFSYEAWKEQLRSFLGSSAETMIAQEAREGKYDMCL